MTNMDELRAKQEELTNTQQELRNIKADLSNKENELENARLENENKKTELIDQLISEIDALQKNAENYEQQITSIRIEVDELQKRLNSTQQVISQSDTQHNTESDTQNNTQSDTQNNTQSDTQHNTESDTQHNTESDTQNNTQSDTQHNTESDTQHNTQFDAQPDAKDSIKLDSYEGYDRVLSQLIFEIEGCVKTANYSRGLNKSGKETLKTAKAKLKQYKDIMSDKKRMLEHECKQKRKLNEKNPDKSPLTLSISGAEINELKNRRFNRRQKIEIDIKEGQAGKSSNIAPWPNQSLEQVKKGNKVDRHHIEYDSKLNAVLSDAAFLRVMDNNQDRAREFLQGIANNSLSDAQILFYQSHMGELSPIFDRYGMRDQVYTCIQTRGGRYNASYQRYGSMDGETAYKTGGVVGWLNNTLIKAFPNAKPEQVSGFTSVAVAAGGIYAIYRIGKWFFGKNKNGNRNLLGKTAGLASLYFIPQLLVGKDGYSLIGNILSGKADFGELGYRLSNCLWFLNNGDKETYEQMAPGVLGMSIFPQTYTVANIRSLQQTFSDQNVRRQWYLSTYNRLNTNNSALANEFKNTFNANEYREAEWKTFLAKLGVTDNTSGDVIIFSEAQKKTDKKTSLELWMKSQGKKRNPDFDKEIDEYLKQEGEFDPKLFEGESYRYWFKDDSDAKYTRRPKDIKNKENLGNQVDKLSLQEQEKSELKLALEKFYDERSIETKPNLNDFNLKLENGFIVIQSHGGYGTKIDLGKKQLDGFGNGITFTNLSDLLNAADLTNKILESQKGKVAVDYPPFKYKRERKGICFDNSKGLWDDLVNFKWSGMDTRVLSTGLLGASGEIKQIDDCLDEYAAYLSKRWMEINGHPSV